MKNKVLSIEQMMHLKELGVDTSKASMVIIYTDSDGCVMDWDEVQEEFTRLEPMEICRDLYDAETGNYDHSYREDCGVFTLQDIIELLPKEIEVGEDTYWLIIYYCIKEWCICYATSNEADCQKIFESELLINCAYNMLCWCAENGYLKGCEK